MKKFDVVILGSGPGGYIAAIRASQLGKKVALIEKDKLGGVCLNRGCIPTKAVLKSAHMVHEMDHLKELGINADINKLDGSQAIRRAKKISDRISKGVGFLMKKNNIEVITGEGKLKDPHTIEVYSSKGHTETIQGKYLILATGARYRTFPGLEQDGKNLIGAWEAIHLEKLPQSIGIIGAGAIGVEFAYFWNAFGVQVHLIELQNRLLPIEDKESSEALEKAYKKYGIKLSLGVKEVQAKNQNGKAIIEWQEKRKKQKHSFDKALIAVGMIGNIENIGLSKLPIKTEAGFIKVNEMGQTNIPHIYAIGDVAGPPLLAHSASHEGVRSVEHLSGKKTHPIDPMNIPSCTYCQPQVASVGYTEQALKEKKIPYKVGTLPFMANGKAIASNETEGFVKTLIGQYGELLGAHIVGTNATELIHEYVLFRTMEGIDEEIFATIHPHPTLGEWLGEAVMAAHGRALNF